MSQLFLIIFGVIIGYLLDRYVQKWRQYKFRRDFRPVVLKPYRPTKKGNGG